MIQPLLTEKLSAVIDLLKKNKVKHAYAFGSVVSGDFRADSDVDLLIKMENGLAEGEYTECFWNLYFGLPEILGRQVDLVMEETVQNPYFSESLNKNKVLIYERRSEKALV